ncbi:MAG: hypothetical protein ACRDP9_27995 [Kribbellaceae bacterium]
MHRPRVAAAQPTRVSMRRWLPGLALGGLAVVLLTRHAPTLTVILFTCYVALGVALPGLVLWRLLTRRRASLVEDLAAGFVVGAAVLLLCYLVTAAAGVQRWSWLWAVPVVVAGIAVPAWRRIWWGWGRQPIRPITGWLLALACAIPLLVVHRHGPERFTPAFTNPRINYPDMPFHTALAASARYDVPLQASWVDGEPMKYHYFFHQLVAAISWATGIDLTHLVYSLLWLPLVLSGAALVFVLTDRIVPGSSWVGPLAVLIATVGCTLQPYAEVALAADMMTTASYLSPTQNLGMALGLLLAVVAVDLLTGDRVWTRWALLVLLTLAASGAKATVLPLVACGFGLVWLVRLTHRRFDRTAFVAGVVVVLVLAGSVAAVFGGESSGLAVRFARAFARMPPYSLLRNTTGLDVDVKAQVATAAVTLLAWTLATAGLLVLLRSPSLRTHPAVIFLAGFSIAGFAAMLLTDQPGNSQMYFHRTAVPAIAVLASAGLCRLGRRLGDPATPLLVGASGVAGLVSCAVARELTAGEVQRSAWSLLSPWLAVGTALVVASAVLATVWRFAGRAGRASLVAATAFTAAAMVGATLVPLMSLVTDAGATGRLFALPSSGGPDRTEAAAARWLERNSRPGDLVATNAHCASRARGVCDARHFWIAALTERHVLVEGWAYTNTVNSQVASTGQSANVLPYWDTDRLRDNDAAFRTPSAATVGKLRDTYGVRWLFADTTYSPVPPELGRFATLRYSEPGVRIYELR